jgi:hypothetical protein
MLKSLRTLAAAALLATSIITTASPASATLTSCTYFATKDAYVNDTQPMSNFGTASILGDMEAHGAQAIIIVTYMTFVVDSACGTSSNYTTIPQIATDGYLIHTSGSVVHEVSSDSWSETGITWNNKPPLDGSVCAIGNMPWQLDLATCVDGAGTYTFAIWSFADSGNFHPSRESASGTATDPRLILVADV